MADTSNWSDFLATPPNLSSSPYSRPILDFPDGSLQNPQNMWMDADQCKQIFNNHPQNYSANPPPFRQTQQPTMTFQNHYPNITIQTQQHLGMANPSNNFQPQAMPPTQSMQHSQQQFVPTHDFNEIENRTLLVRNLHPQTTPEELDSVFKQGDSIKSMDQSKLSSGTVTIEYFDLRVAHSIKASVNGSFIHGNKIVVSYAPLPKIEDPRKPPNNGTIVVFHLPPMITDQFIEQHFSTYGDIRQIRGTPSKLTQRFIEYWDTRAAEEALNKLSGKYIMGSRVSIEFSLPGGFRRTVQKVDQPTVVRNQH